VPAAAALWLALGVGALQGQEHPISWSLGPAHAQVQPAGTAEFVLAARIPPGWHLYSITQAPGGPIPTTIAVGPARGFELAGGIDGSVPHSALDPNFGMITETHEDSAVYHLPVRALSGAGRRTLEVRVSYQTCNNRYCLPPVEDTLRVQVAVAGVPVSPEPTEPAAAVGTPVAAASEAAAAGASPGGASEPAAGGAASTAAPGTAPATDARAALPASPEAAQEALTAAPAFPAGGSSPDRSARGFIAFLWLAAVMGALSLLTPCVFPMVPITISYFSRAQGPVAGGFGGAGQPAGEAGGGRGAGRTRAQAVGDALLYAGGIIGAFTALGLGFALLAGVAGMNRFAANPVLNLAIAALFVLFAVSLFGVLEIALPPRVVNWLYQASSGSRFGRIGTTLLMGVTFAVTTFTCTAPFVGTLLVSAASGDWRWPAAGLLAFSTVFALPFLFLALVPRAVAKLPKSGQWLGTVKATLGFIELAAAFKFISNADLVLGWHVFTRDVVLVSWIVIGLALALYLAGVRLRRPWLGRSRDAGSERGRGEAHTERPARVRAARYPLGGLAVAALVVWLGTGVGGRRLGELDSFLPPASTMSDAPLAGELDWIVDDYDAALAAARQTGQNVLIDFTGYTCTNCRWMEANMFPRPDVTRELERFVRVRLFTDGRSERNQQQQAFEQQKFGTVALPLYVVVDGAGETRSAFLGMTRNASEFISFLSSARQAR